MYRIKANLKEKLELSLYRTTEVTRFRFRIFLESGIGIIISVLFHPGIHRFRSSYQKFLKLQLIVGNSYR